MKGFGGKQQPTEGCRPATREQKTVVTDFAGDGRFCNFLSDKMLREKDLKKIQVND